jgi:hypothetical protein
MIWILRGFGALGGFTAAMQVGHGVLRAAGKIQEGDYPGAWSAFAQGVASPFKAAAGEAARFIAEVRSYASDCKHASEQK